jgi:AraC-like DNA-binding protein
MLGTNGILDPHRGEAHFTLTRHAPSPDLAAFVERYWIVRWSLRTPYAQETLPYPCVNLVVGTHRPGLFGVRTERFVAHLAGDGWVIGAKFRPGGFRPFFNRPVVDLRDREIALADAFDGAGAALERDVHGAPDDAARVACMEAFLLARAPRLDDDTAAAARIFDLAETEPSIARVAALAEKSGRSVRALERLFQTHVGATPKWVIRRFRMHEAAARAAGSAALDWCALAQELGYFDQAHFIRDFKAQVGRTPADYAAACAPEVSRAPRPGAP